MATKTEAKTAKVAPAKTATSKKVASTTTKPKPTKTAAESKKKTPKKDVAPDAQPTLPRKASSASLATVKSMESVKSTKSTKSVGSKTITKSVSTGSIKSLKSSGTKTEKTKTDSTKKVKAAKTSAKSKKKEETDKPAKSPRVESLPQPLPHEEPVPGFAKSTHNTDITQKLAILKDSEMTEEEKFIQYIILYDKYTTAVIEGEQISKSLYHQIVIGLADTLEEFYELVMHHLEEAKPQVEEELKEKVAGLINVLGEYGRSAQIRLEDGSQTDNNDAKVQIELEERIRGQETEITDLKNKLQEVQQKLQLEKERAERLKEERARVSDETTERAANELLLTELKALKHEHDVREAELDKREEGLQELEARVKKTSAEEQEEIEMQMKDLSDTEIKLRKLEQDLEADYLKLRAAQELFDKEKRAFIEKSNHVNEENPKFEELQIENAHLKEEIISLKSELAAANDHITATKEMEFARLRMERASLDALKETLEDESAALLRKNRQLTEESEMLTEEKERLERIREELQRKEECLKEEELKLSELEKKKQAEDIFREELNKAEEANKLRHQAVKRASSPILVGPVSPNIASRANAFAGPTKPTGPVTGKEALLEWCKKCTDKYHGVHISNWGNSWSDGLAMLALVHHHHPEEFNFDTLDKSDKAAVFKLAFDTAEKYGVPKLLDVEDMISMPIPEPLSLTTYVSELYKHFKK